MVTVFSNDPANPALQIPISADVSHEAPTDRSITETLFSEPCAQCHSEPAEGRAGMQLYNAVCAFCHGPGGVGASAGKLAGVGRHDLDKGTSLGVEDKGMPGFSTEAGGPLTREQIDSLLDFIEALE